jgi:hypothetical protein
MRHFAAHRGEAFEMNSEYGRGIVNGELLVGSDMLFASDNERLVYVRGIFIYAYFSHLYLSAPFK